eukprot:gene24025-29153_t
MGNSYAQENSENTEIRYMPIKPPRSEGRMLKQLSKKERQQIVRMEQKAKKRAEKGKKKLVAPTMTPPKLTPLAITVATGLILWFSPQPAGVTLV